MKTPRRNNLFRSKRRIRVIGFDDAPFDKEVSGPVNVAGVVCAGTRFEGMLWGTVTKDGLDATDVIAELVLGSKYIAQVHALLFDGITFGGLNVIDLPALAEKLERPCVAVMRKKPALEAFRFAIQTLPDAEVRLARVEAAGKIFKRSPFVFQTAGIDADDAEALLSRVTDTGHVPEALRLAHLIGAAVIDGQSRGRA